MKRLIAPVSTMALALLIGAGAMVAGAREPRHAAAPPVAGETIGSVDMEEIYNASGAPQDLDQAAQKRQAQGVDRINQIMSVPYLEPAELEEYGTLIGKGQLTPEETKRQEALKAANTARAEEAQTLEAKPAGQLNQNDKVRLAHFAQMKQVLQNQVRPGLLADFRGQQEAWIADYRHHQLVELRQEIAKVAQEKGIAHVFDSGTLVYSVNDLTPVVLQRIAKRAKGK